MQFSKVQICGINTSELKTLTEKEKISLLKEVKNGVTVLRDPMQILEELASSVAKESENSIKRTISIISINGLVYRIYIEKNKKLE